MSERESRAAHTAWDGEIPLEAESGGRVYSFVSRELTTSDMARVAEILSGAKDEFDRLSAMIGVIRSTVVSVEGVEVEDVPLRVATVCMYAALAHASGAAPVSRDDPTPFREDAERRGYERGFLSGGSDTMKEDPALTRILMCREMGWTLAEYGRHTLEGRG